MKLTELQFVLSQDTSLIAAAARECGVVSQGPESDQEFKRRATADAAALGCLPAFLAAVRRRAPRG